MRRKKGGEPKLSSKGFEILSRKHFFDLLSIDFVIFNIICSNFANSELQNGQYTDNYLRSTQKSVRAFFPDTFLTQCTCLCMAMHGHIF